MILLLAMLAAAPGSDAALSGATSHPASDAALSGATSRSALGADEAVQIALANSPAIRALEERHKEEQARGEASTALENPVFRLTNLRSDHLLSPALNGGTYGAHPFANTNLGARWTPPNPFVNSARLTEAARRSDEVDAELDAARRALAARVRTLHATLLSLDRQLELARTAVGLREQLASLARKRLAEHAGRGLDQSLADLDHLEARTQQLELERTKRETLRELAVQLGVSFQGKLELGGAPPTCQAPTDEDAALVSRALERSSRLRAQQAKRAAVDAEQSQARRELIPWFDFVQLSYVLASDNDPAYGSLGLGLTLPLFNWNGGKLRQLSARAARFDLELDVDRRVLKSQVEQTLADVREDALVVARYREAEPAVIAQAGVQLERSLEVGESSLTQIALVQTRSLGAQRAWLRAELHCQVSLIELERLTGGSP